MDEITDRKQAELIRRGLADEQMRAKLMRDLFSPDEQVQLRAMESLRDYLGDKIRMTSAWKCDGTALALQAQARNPRLAGIDR